MTTSSPSSPPLPARSRRLLYLALVLSLVGFADALYLSVEHLRGVIPTCTLVNGCERVLTSAYSAVFGVPVAYFGALYYLAVFALGALVIETGRGVKNLRLVILLGFLATLWFISVQAFILKAWCLYCLASAIITTLLFATIFALGRTSSHEQQLQ